MRKPHRFLSARERHQFEQLWQLKMAATDLHNVDAFFKRGASLDLLELSVFPRSSVVKEISECEALREAAIRYLDADPTDPNIVAICPGDGASPRLAALLAFTTHWRCISVDPMLTRWLEKWPDGAATRTAGKVQRLEIIASTCEAAAGQIKLEPNQRAMILACHSHASLDAALAMVAATFPEQIAAVALKCCVDQIITRRPHDLEYCDDGIFSPKRMIKVWKSLCIGAGVDLSIHLRKHD